MITQLTTIEELKEIFFELLFNHTDKVTKQTPGSVVNAIGYGVARTGQAAIKDIALLETRILPESSYGTYLDDVAAKNGIAPRLGPFKSSTYVRVVAEVGTSYVAGTHTFVSTQGVVFDVMQTTVVGDAGFAYIPVRSQLTGAQTTVEASTITTVQPAVTGHIYCINEAASTGGIDLESDDVFRERVIKGPNQLARSTNEMIRQVFMKINPAVLAVQYGGFDDLGNVVLKVISQNGADFTSTELNEMLVKSSEFLALTELRQSRFSNVGLRLVNPDWFPVDISFRCELESSVDVDQVRKQAQINTNKVYDYRFFNDDFIYQSDLITAIKQTPGVKHLFDKYFYPAGDVFIPQGMLPRLRSFLMLDSAGAVLSSGGNTLNPIYYPSVADLGYQKTVFKNVF